MPVKPSQKVLERSRGARVGKRHAAQRSSGKYTLHSAGFVACVREDYKQRVHDDGSSSSSSLLPNPVAEADGEELDLDDGLDEEHQADVPSDQLDALDAQLAAELHAQLNNFRRRHK